MALLALVAATLLWVIVLVSAPRAASAPLSRWMAGPVLSVYALGSVICHQRPERSFVLWQTAMPVCARCTGIYFGALVAAAALMVRRRNRALTTRQVRWGLSMALTPGLMTLLYEWVTHETPSNLLRAASGVPLGFVVLGVIGAVLGAPGSDELH
jgi:uncharacterized membrane protein